MVGTAEKEGWNSGSRIVLPAAKRAWSTPHRPLLRVSHPVAPNVVLVMLEGAAHSCSNRAEAVGWPLQSAARSRCG